MKKAGNELNAILIINRNEDVNEAIALMKTLGYNVVDTYVVKGVPDSRFYIGKGKLDRLKELIEKENVSKIYIYDSVKPRQIVNLMRELKVEVLDKIQLILEIFAQHAGSKEAKLQIEMAKIKHELPLIREWVRRAKLGELPGFLGPGAYAIDAYYRMMRRRLSVIRERLEKLRERRRREREKRRRLGLPHVSISGYTNAGKTTLFNVIVKETKPTGNEMFTTLSPKAKAAIINGCKIVFVDTVGFIRNVPVEVIEAFYATLEEIVYSDLNLLVIDGSEPIELIKHKLTSSINTLKTIGFMGKPMIIAFNKIDLVGKDLENRRELVEKIAKENYPLTTDVIPISALKRMNIDTLKGKILEAIK